MRSDSPDLPDMAPLTYMQPDTQKTGVLLANLGTPDGTGYWAMRRYLSEFLSDQRVIDYSPWLWQPLLQLIILSKRPFTSGRAYKSIWNEVLNESPLLTITRAQAKKLEQELNSEGQGKVFIEFGMRYGNPSIGSAMQKLQKQGCKRVIFFPLYPQYSAPTTATANDSVFQSLAKTTWQPALRTVPAYFDHPLYIEALANSVTRSYAQMTAKPRVLLVSFHGMPVRYRLQGDPYFDHCQKTAQMLRDQLGMSSAEMPVCFQSQFGHEEWLQPYTADVVKQLAISGEDNIAVIAPAFSADCVETLEEIDCDLRDLFLTAGGRQFTYIPCLNEQDDHISMMAKIIKTEASGWLQA